MRGFDWLILLQVIFILGFLMLVGIWLIVWMVWTLRTRRWESNKGQTLRPQDEEPPNLKVPQESVPGTVFAPSDQELARREAEMYRDSRARAHAIPYQRPPRGFVR